MDKAFIFSENGGEYTIRGKPRWPHMILVEIPRERALEVLSDLVQAMRTEDPVVSLTLFGSLEDYKEDEPREPNQSEDN